MPTVVSTGARFVRLYAGASKPGLFWLTPDTPQSRVFRHLGSEQQLVCLRSPPVAADRPPPSLQELARFYADSVMEAGVKGPVALTGFCIAAVLAREVAIELQGRGVEIRAVVMIDPPDPAESRAAVSGTPLGHRLRVALRRIGLHLGRIVKLGPRGGLEYVRGSLHGIWKRIHYQRSKRAHEQAMASGQGTDPAYTDDYLLSVAAFMNASPRVWDGRATIIRPTDAPWGVFDYPNLRWRELIRGGVEIVEVPGSSDTMWQEPAVSAMAQAVKRFSAPG